CCTSGSRGARRSPDGRLRRSGPAGGSSRCPACARCGRPGPPGSSRRWRERSRGRRRIVSPQRPSSSRRWPRPGPPRPRRPPPDAAPQPVAPPAGSIAVLPFVNLSADPENEYFSEGMTEEIINALTRVAALRVASRTASFAFKGAGQDIRVIGEKLQVRTLLEGSVRRAGEKLRITAQLINVADGYHLWSSTYERELRDVFAMQDEIARAIVGALRVKLV